MRRKWLKLARRKDAHCLSTTSRIYFCEDHFDLPNDMLNYTEYHIMGKVSYVRMKPVVYQVNLDVKKTEENEPAPVQTAIHDKKQRMSTIAVSSRKLYTKYFPRTQPQTSSAEEQSDSDISLYTPSVPSVSTNTSSPSAHALRVKSSSDCSDFIAEDRKIEAAETLLRTISITLVRPPSVEKGAQMTKSEAKETKQIASLRIHIERVLRQKFYMIRPHACLHFNFVKILDDVIIIPCALINLQDSLIK
ncbi:hypothetical protein evm_002908 [Chilo suppressalis]|nr:hypothetical protein evm_002908 [Chilo suppressalis]